MEKQWLVYLGTQVVMIIYVPVEWALKKVKEYVILEWGYDYSIDLKAAN